MDKRLAKRRKRVDNICTLQGIISLIKANNMLNIKHNFSDEEMEDATDMQDTEDTVAGEDEEM